MTEGTVGAKIGGVIQQTPEADAIMAAVASPPKYREKGYRSQNTEPDSKFLHGLQPSCGLYSPSRFLTTLPSILYYRTVKISYAKEGL